MSETPTLYQNAKTTDDSSGAFLENHGVRYRMGSRQSDEENASELDMALDEYRSQLPIFVWKDGTRIVECDADKLADFLRDRGVQLEDS